jgi:hypothetical protein
MTYHISQIVNNSAKSVAITNPASNPDGRDDRITIRHTTYNPPNPIQVNFITNISPVTYQQAVLTALNAYTFLDNYCFWDNGSSALWGVGEDTPPPNNIKYYEGDGTYLRLIVNANGSLTFEKA